MKLSYILLVNLLRFRFLLLKYALFLILIKQFSIFSKLSGYDFNGWAVLEWECCIKSPEQGAKEGAIIIQNHIIEVTEKAFDDFANSGTDQQTNKKILGIN